MKNIISEELDYMKYLLGYSKGVVISEQTKTGCIKGNCVNGTGTYKFKNGNVYEGTWKDGKANGEGTYKWPDGDEYTGEFKDGNFNGQGTYKHTDGSVYVGQFKDNDKNGQGTYTNKNGVESSGVWVDDKLDGKSIDDLDKVTKSNQTKTGCIQGDCKNGEGTYKWEDGDEYTGTWKDGKKNGQGTFKRSDGDIVFVGQWKDGRRDGEGTIKYSDGRVIEGQFQGINGPTGQGTYTNKNGVKSSGVWVNDKLDGKSRQELDKLTQSNQTKTECKQPTEPTHRYKDDKNYQYAKSGDCWWAKNITNNRWFNLTELVKTRPNIQISIDKLNDGTNLIKL